MGDHRTIEVSAESFREICFSLKLLVEEIKLLREDFKYAQRKNDADEKLNV